METVKNIYETEINAAIEAAGFKSDKVVAHMKKSQEARIGTQRVVIVSNWKNKRGQLVRWKWFIEGTFDHWIAPVKAKALHWVSSTKQDYERYFASGAEMLRIDKFFKFGSKPKVHAQLDKPGTRKSKLPYQWGKSWEEQTGQWSAKSDAAWKRKGFKETARYKKVKAQGDEAVKAAAKEWFWKDILKKGKDFGSQYDHYSMGHMVSGIEGSGNDPVVAGKRAAKARLIVAIKRGAGRTVGHYKKYGVSEADITGNTPTYRRTEQLRSVASPVAQGYRKINNEKDIVTILRELEDW